ncbi:chain length determinant family protein [Motilimonas cestriensis]|uniref:Chain length determinant family protein n=1 Tax=Motilimonas cestriensis TaxID=2742685 RepID=A0ABS8W7V7_9GAMM|nr:XrtA system polysaccharide chain length determinant [Motilimonas cestriensis]MCE2594192.1 chain length determinant family protein [Motilimonas cestriensis]
MKELIEKALYYIKGVWMKRRFIIIIAWIICPIGWLYVMQMPDQYKASARVYVDTDSLLKPLLRGLTVETFKDQQLNLMVKTLLSRPNVEKIARMADLDILTNSSEEFDKLVDSLSKEIKIGTTKREKIFTISYQQPNPESAKSVVQSVLTIFVEDTLGETRTDTDNAQRFLNQQIKDFEKRMTADDAALTEFKRQYADLLPGKGNSYYDMLKAEETQLENTQLQLKEAQTRLFSARIQLEDEESLPVPQVQSQAVYNPSIITQYDSRLNQLNQMLDEMNLRYTDKHPDIIELKRQIADLVQKQRQERAELASINYQQSRPAEASESPFVQSLRLNVSQLENEIASLKVRVENYQDKVAKLQEKVHLVPKVEADLAALTRGYDITKGQYNQLLERRESAIMSQKAGQSTEGVEFKVIEPPRVANDPAGPNRIILLSVVTLLGLGLGIFVAFAISQIKPIITGPKELAAMIKIPVLGAISHSNIEKMIQVKRRHNIAFALVIIALLCIYGGLLVTQTSNHPFVQQLKTLVAAT